MNLLPNFRTGKKDPDTPRLIPTDGLPAEPVPGLPRPDPADNDLSFEDALADRQFSRFLHAEYDVQAPGDSFARLLSSIESGNQPERALKPQRRTFLQAIAFSGRAFASAFSRPVAARVTSGLVAAALMAAVLVPNISMVLKDSQASSPASEGPVSGYAAPGNLDVVIPHTRNQVSVGTPRLYDRDSLIQSDPPDTIVPPKRTFRYQGEPQTPEIGSPFTVLRKE
jgi:hypothetical protein